MGGLLAELRTIIALPGEFDERHFAGMLREQAIDEVIAFARSAYEAKERELGEEKMRMLERLVIMGTIDRLWVYHLTALDETRHGVGLSGYGGLDPLVVFKHEAHDMWQQLTEHIR